MNRELKASGLLLALALTGCVGSSKGPSVEQETAEVRAYLSKLAPTLVSRPLSAEESALTITIRPE